MEASNDTEQIDRLYALPLDEFTRERDALAKRLRAGGERGAAQRVAALRKPSLTAWAINRLRNRAPERVEELLAAGGQLRAAQAQVIASGDRASFRDAVARERELVEELAAEAAAELSASGRVPSETLRSRLFATLHATAADDEVRALVASGQLVRDYEVADLGLGSDAGLRTGPGQESASPRKTAPKQRGRELTTARKRLEQSIAAGAKASQERQRAERGARAAEKALVHAKDRLRSAANAVEHAESVLAGATHELEAAKVRDQQARELVASLERTLAALSP